ncbi:RHS repeat-associated core domain-containing protein, partial [Anaerocolumna jejuensis DSM 15929]
FLWSGNTLLHEWEVGEEGKRKLRERAGEKADYLLKIEEKADQKARADAVKGSVPPNGLITWVFQDDFIPRAKLTEEDAYSIISDYLGTPVEAYDEEGKKVWERGLDIYGRVKTSLKDKFGRTTDLVGEDGFIPFRYQGQYEDVETGLYYNRFRYYDPEIGQYTQQDPIGLAGGNPTIYGYVRDPNIWIDPWGLIEVFRNLRPDEIISEGLSARVPGRGMSVAGHIMNGTKHNGSQFISTTTDINVAMKWNNSGQTMVRFDTEDVIPDILGNKSIVDVSNPTNARNVGLGGRSYSNAVSSKEVLIEGKVPADKIEKVSCIR